MNTYVSFKSSLNNGYSQTDQELKQNNSKLFDGKSINFESVKSQLPQNQLAQIRTDHEEMRQTTVSVFSQRARSLTTTNNNNNNKTSTKSNKNLKQKRSSVANNQGKNLKKIGLTSPHNAQSKHRRKTKKKDPFLNDRSIINPSKNELHQENDVAKSVNGLVQLLGRNQAANQSAQKTMKQDEINKGVFSGTHNPELLEQQVSKFLHAKKNSTVSDGTVKKKRKKSAMSKRRDGDTIFSEEENISNDRYASKMNVRRSLMLKFKEFKEKLKQAMMDLIQNPDEKVSITEEEIDQIYSENQLSLIGMFLQYLHTHLGHEASNPHPPV